MINVNQPQVNKLPVSSSQVNNSEVNNSEVDHSEVDHSRFYYSEFDHFRVGNSDNTPGASLNRSGLASNCIMVPDSNGKLTRLKKSEKINLDC
mmetsp:Transcript_2759/g.2305  ORF Transcript_2759/g.2305 Transcript_2759/m.2305 type:complete len:93 (+) Transcript_2759:529-807(+)